MESCLSNFFTGIFTEGVTYKHTWPNHKEYCKPPTYKAGEKPAYDRDALYVNGKEYTFEMLRAKIYREKAKQLSRQELPPASSSLVSNLPPPLASSSSSSSNLPKPTTSLSSSSSNLPPPSTSSSSSSNQPRPSPSSSSSCNPPLPPTSLSTSSYLPPPSLSLTSNPPLPPILSSSVGSNPPLASSQLLVPLKIQEGQKLQIGEEDAPEVPAAKRPRTSMASNSVPFKAARMSSLPFRIPSVPQPRFSRRSSVSSRRSSIGSGHDFEEEPPRPGLGDDTLQFLDNMPELSQDSFLAEHDPQDREDLTASNSPIPSLPPVPCSQQEPPAVERVIPCFAVPLNRMDRSLVSEETTGIVGQQVARLFDQTLEDLPEWSSRSQRSDRPPTVSTIVPAFPPQLPSRLAKPAATLTSLLANESQQSSTAPTESTLFTVQDRPAPPVSLGVFEDFSELTAPCMQSMSSAATNETRTLIPPVWEKVEDEAAEPLLPWCSRLPCDGPVEIFADSMQNALREAIAPALRHHSNYCQQPTAFGALPALPPLVPQSYAHHLKLPKTRPTLQLGSIKYEVLHCLHRGHDTVSYSVRCPNPPPPDCHPAAYCGTEMEDTELCWSEISCLKMGTTEKLRWEYYICSELKARIPSQEHRRFHLTSGLSYEFTDQIFLQLKFNPNPTLADFGELMQGRGAIDEAILVYWAIEMLNALEVLVNAGIVHAAIDLTVWKIRDFPIEDEHWHNWSADGALGWNLKGLELTHFANAIDVRLFTQPEWVTFTGMLSDVSPSPEQMCAIPWRHHVDAFGIATCLHQLLLQQPIQLVQATENGTKIWRQKAALKPWLHCKMWQLVFDALLNLPPNAPMQKIRECRSHCEQYLMPPGCQNSAIKIYLKALRVKVWGQGNS